MTNIANLFGPPIPVTPVTRFAADYTLDEQLQIRRAFRAIVGRYRECGRRSSWWCLVILVVSFGLWWGAVFQWEISSRLPSLGLAVVLAGLCIYRRRQPVLQCPACRNAVAWQLDRYCPKCGSDQLSSETALVLAACRACGTNFPRGIKTFFLVTIRPYKIRACTYRGVLLDENGV
jgi:hypothetical protein